MRARILSVLTVIVFLGSMVAYAFGAPSASSGFNNIVIIAMENQSYGSVIGCGSCAPFINNQLVPVSTTISNYHSYGQNINGCSAGCYEAFTSGQQSHSDSWCPRASSPCFTINNVADQFKNAGVSMAMFCEDGCPRGADHFPWIAYTSTWNSCLANSGGVNCSGQTGPDGNALYNSQSSNGNAAFINYLNGGSPANYIWFTPTDNHNMHDNSVSSGDSYLQTLLVGTGSVSSPSANSVLGSNLFKGGKTLLYLWWDEYDPSPNVFYQPGNIKQGFTSTGGYDEYNSLHMIESNWGIPGITSVVAGDSVMPDLFGNIILTCTGFTSLGFTSTPAQPTIGQAVSFSGSINGGQSPLAWSWTFGDGSSGTGSSTSHTYSTAGTFNIGVTVTDSCPNGIQSASNSGTVTVGGICTGCQCNGSCPPPPKGVLCTTLCGWGGIRMDEATSICPTHTACTNSTTVASIVPGGGACGGNQCDMERTVAKMASLGYNTVRVDFDPFCTDTTDNNYMSAYNVVNAQAAIAIAKAYSFTVIFDYHASTPPTDNMVASVIPCWLSFWAPIITVIGPTYSNIIWEPWNEPTLTNSTDTVNLSNWYQQWINQARSLNDNHYIVVQSLCSNYCGFADQSRGYPTVTDPMGKVYISLHTYISPLYQSCSQFSSGWSATCAQFWAQTYFNWEVTGAQRTGWKVLNTEMGADILCRPTINCPSWYDPVKYQWVGGSAGGDMVSSAFVQDIVTLYQQNRYGFMMWTAGSWTDTPNSGTYGSLCSACGYAGTPGWGSTLNLGSSSVTIVQCFGLPTVTCVLVFGSVGVAVPSAVGVMAVALRRKKKNGS